MLSCPKRINAMLGSAGRRICRVGCYRGVKREKAKLVEKNKEKKKKEIEQVKYKIQ